MAKRAFDEWSLVADANHAAIQPVLSLVAPLFDNLGLRVIALSKKDSRWSIRPRDRLVKLIERVFGIYQANALADPRLEAIRRYAIVVRTISKRARVDETDRFLATGFTHSHADFIAHHVGAKPSPKYFFRKS